ncbi:MAG: hypothetical protein QGG53_17595 [Planctomycetota bacterium]|jgi:hypothetical protein|nr:hypothetical protein [Planctomycetota bacterium]
MKTQEDFRIEALVDFVDDASSAEEPIGEAHIDSMMQRLVECGVRRVSWSYYGDGHGGYFFPAPGFEGTGKRGWTLAETYQRLGNPLRVAVEAARRHGLEIYAYFKPYETGIASVYPEGSPEAQRWGRLAHIGGRLSWLDRFVVDRPDLRIRRKTDDLPPDILARPVHAIRLVKQDDSPTRINREHLQLWASPLNYRYQQLPFDFEVHETVEPSPKEVRDHAGNVLTCNGDPVRVLTLSGFELNDPYLAVLTDFTEGPADFMNAGTDLSVALDSDGREIPGVTATGGAIWYRDQVDLYKWGLMFDYGWGRQPVTLDNPATPGERRTSGFVAFARGRNAYLPGALCETEPEVQEYWLSCVGEMLDAGVDGIDFREENHSTHTDYPEDYGYNPAVLAGCESRGTDDIAQVRGDAYTDFLRRANALIRSAGRQMRYNLQIDWFRPDPSVVRAAAYPLNIDFQWQRWIDDGLMDEAILRFYHFPFECLYEDSVALEMIERCQAKGIPMTVNRYIRAETLADEFRRIERDERFSGFILYETNTFMRAQRKDSFEITMPEVQSLKKTD